MTEREAIATAIIWLREAATKLPNAQVCRMQIQEAAQVLSATLGQPDDAGVLVAGPCGEWCDQEAAR